MPDYASFFHAYAQAYERSLGDQVDVTGIRAFFAESFVSANVNGQVMAGANDDAFAAQLVKGYAFYKAIGTRSMKVERVEAQPLYEGHDRVRVFFVAGYRKRDGAELSIPFDGLYLLQRRQDGPKIFGFISGDETALYQQHGLVDETGHPVNDPSASDAAHAAA